MIADEDEDTVFPDPSERLEELMTRCLYINSYIILFFICTALLLIMFNKINTCSWTKISRLQYAFHVIIYRVRSKDHKKRAQTRIPFSLGGELDMAVGV